MAGVGKRERIKAAAVTTVAAILVNILFAAPVAAAARVLGLWTYPVFLGVNCGIAAFVLGVLIPNEYGDWTKRMPTWVRDRLAWLRKVVTFNEPKFAQHWFGRMLERLWNWIKGKGAFWAILAISLIATTPAAGAVLARTLKLPEREAWRYSMLSAAVFTVASISVYLGLVTPVIDWFVRVF